MSSLTELQALIRREVGGTPVQVPAAYARRSPARYIQKLVEGGVPLQLYWSVGDRVIADQRVETGELASTLLDAHPDAHVWDFAGDWAHTAEMRANRRLPRALARFGLLPWRDAPSVSSAPGAALARYQRHIALEWHDRLVIAHERDGERAAREAFALGAAAATAVCVSAEAPATLCSGSSSPGIPT